MFDWKCGTLRIWNVLVHFMYGYFKCFRKRIKSNWWYCKFIKLPRIFRYGFFGTSFKIFFYHIWNNFDVGASGTCYRQRTMSLTHHQKYNYFVNSFSRTWKIYASQWTGNSSICARLMHTEYNNYFYLHRWTRLTIWIALNLPNFSLDKTVALE